MCCTRGPPSSTTGAAPASSCSTVPNNGMLHAVNGNQTRHCRRVAAGREYWSFIAEEGIPKLKRLRNEAPAVEFASTPSIGLGPDRAPGLLLRRPAELLPEARLERRHGEGLPVRRHAPGRPGPLRFRRHRSHRGRSSCGRRHLPRSCRLGQTWSEARVAMIKGHSNPVIVMGAGYDAAAEDADPPGPVTMGNAVLVLDAVDGTLLKQFPTSRAGSRRRRPDRFRLRRADRSRICGGSRRARSIALTSRVGPLRQRRTGL